MSTQELLGTLSPYRQIPGVRGWGWRDRKRNEK